MSSLEIKTEQGTFGIDLQEDFALSPHFYIKCICGGKDGKYSGSRLRGVVKNGKPNQFDCTFYRCVHGFADSIEEQEGKDLVLVCNDCEREFPFNTKSYRELIKTIEQASAEDRRDKT